MEKPNDPSPDEPKNAGQPVTRRDVVAAVAKLIALGALSHFTLLAGKSFAGTSDDWCPYGTPDEGDVCDPGNGNDDICLDGSNDNDECPNYKERDDKCTSGEGWQDKCPEDGGIDAGDYCYGGGDATNGHEQDTCANGKGDECAGGIEGPNAHDKCKDTSILERDNCGPFAAIPKSDDTCYNGTDSGTGRGGDDFCLGNSQGMDKCFDSTDKQDKCAGGWDEIVTGRADTCFNDKTDHCLEIKGDPDLCPGGGMPDDVCPNGLLPEDVCLPEAIAGDYCPGSRRSADQQQGGSH